MLDEINIYFLLLLILGGLYFILISLFTIGWFRLRNHNFYEIPDISSSVIVAMRNEEENIYNLLQDLKNQSYKNFNIIIVDDHSEDQSSRIVNNFIFDHPEMNIKLLHASNHGKKSAIQQAILFSSSEVIICTDADCRLGNLWVQKLLKRFAEQQVLFVSGPVAYSNSKSFFQAFQSIEFLSLITSGAGAIGIGSPVMCNGANLAFRKSAFEKVSGFVGNKNIASGDDVFLLHKIKKNFGSKAICFLKDKLAIVSTESAGSIGELLRQRKRWASKSKSYKDELTIFTGIVIILYNLLISILVIASIFNHSILGYGILGLGVKILADFALLSSGCLFFNKKSLMWYYLPVQIFYPFYTTLVAILAFFTRNTWKGRKL